MPDELAERVTAAKGDVPWNTWILRACEAALDNLTAGDSAATSGVASRPVKACGRTMVGSGTDTYDPACELAAGHDGPCRSSWATSQHRIRPGSPAPVDRFRQHGVIPASEVAAPCISAAPILRVDEAKRNVKPIPKAGKK